MCLNNFEILEFSAAFNLNFKLHFSLVAEIELDLSGVVDRVDSTVDALISVVGVYLSDGGLDPPDPRSTLRSELDLVWAI